jgi:hypothetical protein
MNPAPTLSAASPPALLPQETPPDIVAFYTYWLSLPRAESSVMPRLSDYFDHAPPKLQPFVAISDVISPANIKVRLMGTGLVNMVGRDPTGSDLSLLYSESLRSLMYKVAWQAATRPVGYIAVRNVRTRAGQIVQNPTICLPLANPPSSTIALITYAKISGVVIDIADDDQLQMVQDVRVTHWIDLGAGVPEF